jgi:hypothetical protein
MGPSQSDLDVFNRQCDHDRGPARPKVGVATALATALSVSFKAAAKPVCVVMS